MATCRRVNIHVAMIVAEWVLVLWLVQDRLP
jgi:hypothetical protein